MWYLFHSVLASPQMKWSSILGIKYSQMRTKTQEGCHINIGIISDIHIPFGVRKKLHNLKEEIKPVTHKREAVIC